MISLRYILVISVLLSSGMLCQIGCVDGETYLKEEIDKAAACQADSDCVDIGGKCPLGCHIVVHKDQATRIKQLVDDFPSNCDYDCIAIDSITCTAGKCTANTR